MARAQSQSRPLPAGTTATAKRPIRYDEWVASKEAAAALQISEKTLRNWRSARRIAFRLVGRQALFHPDDLNRVGSVLAPSEEFAQTDR
jgi:hypothetical protein